MTPTLTDLHDLASLLDIESEWASCTHMKTIRLHADNSHKSLTGKDKTGSWGKVGVYRHTAIIDGQLAVVYVGMAKAGDSCIGNRQSRHFASFKHTHYTNERSGEKYRKLLEKLSLAFLDIRIEYVDLTHLNSGVISFFESLSIDHFQPLINQLDKSSRAK